MASQFPHASTQILQTLAKGLSKCLNPNSIQDFLKSMMDKKENQKFTAELLHGTNFPCNILGLGMEEIGEVPQAIDVSIIVIIFYLTMAS